MTLLIMSVYKTQKAREDPAYFMWAKAREDPAYFMWAIVQCIFQHNPYVDIGFPTLRLNGSATQITCDTCFPTEMEELQSIKDPQRRQRHQVALLRERKQHEDAWRSYGIDFLGLADLALVNLSKSCRCP